MIVKKILTTTPSTARAFRSVSSVQLRVFRDRGSLWPSQVHTGPAARGSLPGVEASGDVGNVAVVVWQFRVADKSRQPCLLAHCRKPGSGWVTA